MPNGNPLQEPPNTGSLSTAATPLSQQGPDTARMPTLSQAVAQPGAASGDEVTNLQAQLENERTRRSGEASRFEKDRRQWETERIALNAQMTQLQEQFNALKQAASPAQQQAAEPATATTEAPAQTQDALDTALNEIKARQYRDLLVTEIAKETGVPVNLFAEHIQIVPPTIKNGNVDDSGQRAVIVAFAENLKKLQKDDRQSAQNALLEGTLPGSSPGAPAPQTGATLYDEFLKISSAYGAEGFSDLSREEQDKIEQRYYELTADPRVQSQHAGVLAPTGTMANLEKTVRRLSQEVEELRGKNPLRAAV